MEKGSRVIVDSKNTDALNQVTEFTYDPANGNLLTTKDPLNHVTTIAYNTFGQPISVQGPIPTEPPTTFAYDAQGNLITTTDPLGNQTQRTYGAVSRLISLTDPRGLVTQFRYDDLNHVTEIADARNGLTRFGYDPNGNLLSVTDAKNQTTTYTYDNMDRLATRKDALNRQESYQYDPAGNLSQFTDRKNQPSTFTYDALNRRTTVQYADASTTSFIYDSVGRLSVAEDSSSGRIEFAYDDLDRLMKELTPQGVVNYGYDALGRRTTMTANGQAPVGYQYDAASRLTQVAQGAQVVGLGYDAAGRRTSLTYPNGTSTTYGYDFSSRLTNLLHQGPAGVIESLSYTYDAAGNRINLTRSNGTTSLLPQAVQAEYDAANEQIQFNSGTPNLTYDANGNLQTQTDASGTTTYSWDARNRLVAISGPGLSASFVYDALGRRVSKTINGETTQFLYDGKEIMQEIGQGAVNASYLRSFRFDDPFVRQSQTNEFYLVDPVHSTLVLTDNSGAVRASYAYDPYGTESVTGDSANTFAFTGRENDRTGLYFYRNRYLSPTRARFISRDPAGLRGGINPYAYVKNNPINNRDPFGLQPTQDSTVVVNCGSTATLNLKTAVILTYNDIRRSGCINCDDRNNILKKLTNLRITCDQPGDSPSCGANACACAFQGTNDIILTPDGWSGGCGCLQSRIVHEATHLIAPVGDVSQDKPESYQNCLYPNGNLPRYGNPLNCN